jgi:uncharacterized damage-inducible protein DinB
MTAAMITPAYAQLMARYNVWQNASLYGAASTLTDDARKLDRGAFFGSIHGTLCHLVFGDQAWMHRFAGTPPPKAKSIAEATNAIQSWDELSSERRACDAMISQWAAALEPAWLEGDLTWYSGAMGRDITRPRAALVAHMFNHQTHHRGQVHAMLTAAGATPEATDIPFMPD